MTPIFLYELPRKSYFMFPEGSDVFFFDHVDGMYSYCVTSDGEIAHFNVMAPVIPLCEKELPDVALDKGDVL